MCTALIAAGCRGDPPARPPSELRAGLRSIGSLDPLAVSVGESSTGEKLVQRQIFEGLVGYDPVTLRPRPALAASWKVSADARTYTFLLRQGAKFHGGRPVTLQDVLFSLNRLARAACGAGASPTAGAPSYLLSLIVGYPETAGSCKAPTLSGLTGLGSRTVSVSLSEPWADFPAALGNVAASIVPASMDEKSFGSRPVGTGPYAVASPWDGRTIRLARFEGYWGSRASTPSLVFAGYADESSAYVDLLRGTLHYAPVPPNRFVQSRRRFGETGLRRGVGLYFFGFNLRSQRVAPRAFREGLSRSVDRESLATAVFGGTREPARGLASPALPGSAGRTCRRLCVFGLDAAREKIAEGYPQGPPEITIGVSSGGANPPVAEALARMFAAAGVTARIVERPFAEHVRGVAAGDVDVFQLGWIPDYPALDGLFWPLFRSTAQDNYMRYASPDVDRLLSESRRTLDERRRAGLLVDAEKRVIEDVPILPLLWYRAAVAVDARLRPAGSDAIVVDGLGLTSFGPLAFSAE